MTGIRVITVPEGELARVKAEAHEKNYIVRTHKSIYDDCWKLTLVEKKLADSWNPLTRTMRMIILASPVWVTEKGPEISP